MSEDPLFHLKYPIGTYEAPEVIQQKHIDDWINQISALPSKVRQATKGITEEQLDTPYRPDGWTVRQVIHHIPDSHVNSYIRFKWALTEETPTIKAYNEADWAELFDTKDQPIEVSLNLLEVVHHKLVKIMQGMDDEMLKRTFLHPESGKTLPLEWYIGQYAWHGEHHLAHIKSVIEN